MSYDYHITRAATWGESELVPITQAEWEAVADRRGDLVHDSYIEWMDIGLQKTYKVVGEEAHFSWSYGKVDILGAFTEGVRAVAEEIASVLGAHVQGDDE